VAIEVNLLSFIPLVLQKNKFSRERAVKYFLVQRLASVLVITRFSLIRFNYFLSRLSIRLFILLKLGAAPLHQ